MVRDPLRRIGAATPGRGSDRAQATPQPAATVIVGGQRPDQPQLPEQVEVPEHVGVRENAARRDNALRAENAARADQLDELEADQPDELEAAEDAARPEPVPLLEPRDGMPPLVASAAALDERSEEH